MGFLVLQNVLQFVIQNQPIDLFSNFQQLIGFVLVLIYFFLIIKNQVLTAIIWSKKQFYWFNFIKILKYNQHHNPLATYRLRHVNSF